MFDQYRVNMIVFKFMPLVNNFDTPAANQGAPAANIPTLITVVDNTDITPVGVTGLVEYGNARSYQFNKPIVVKFRPAIQAAVLVSGGSTAAAAPKFKQWLNCDNTNIQHLGLKVAIASLPAATTQYFMKLQSKFYLSFKKAR